MNQLLQGRTAVVTGAGRGIGAAIAVRLAAEGAWVAVTDVDADTAREVAASIVEQGGLARALELNVTDTASVETAVAAVIQERGGVQILVNNAAISGPLAPVAEYPEAQWTRVLDANLTGPFRCAKAVIPHMLEAKYGRIVNIASISGKEGTPIWMSAYASSKAGLIGFTKNLARELGPSGILVNCIAPAGIPSTGFMKWTEVPKELSQSSSPIPLGRHCDPAEIAAMVAWLASEECSYSSGAVFDMTGGRSTY
jgi:2-dehydro-3-deoxy-L-rhamnonate dehydrogenase (NAD+)